MGVLDGAGAEASAGTQARHFSSSCAEKAHRDACAAGSSSCFSPGTVATVWLGRPPEVSSAYMLAAYLLSFLQRSSQSHPEPQAESSIRQSQPDFPVMSGLCNPQQRKANSKIQYPPGFPGQWTATWSPLVHSWSRQ